MQKSWQWNMLQKFLPEIALVWLHIADIYRWVVSYSIWMLTIVFLHIAKPVVSKFSYSSLQPTPTLHTVTHLPFELYFKQFS